MTNRARVAITLATALLFGAWSYGSAFAINPPGVLGSIWNASGWIVYGLAILSAFAVYRWWAVLPAVAPVAVTVYLHNMTNYEAPWREESIGDFSESPLIYALFVLAAILLQAAVLAIGLLLRAAWEWVRSRQREGSLPSSA